MELGTEGTEGQEVSPEKAGKMRVSVGRQFQRGEGEDQRVRAPRTH